MNETCESPGWLLDLGEEKREALACLTCLVFVANEEIYISRVTASIVEGRAAEQGLQEE